MGGDSTKNKIGVGVTSHTKQDRVGVGVGEQDGVGVTSHTKQDRDECGWGDITQKEKRVAGAGGGGGGHKKNKMGGGGEAPQKREGEKQHRKTWEEMVCGR